MATLRISWKLAFLWHRHGLPSLYGYCEYHAGWLIYEIGESSSAKMDEDLAKEVFTFT